MLEITFFLFLEMSRAIGSWRRPMPVFIENLSGCWSRRSLRSSDPKLCTREQRSRLETTGILLRMVRIIRSYPWMVEITVWPSQPFSFFFLKIPWNFSTSSTQFLTYFSQDEILVRFSSFFSPFSSITSFLHGGTRFTCNHPSQGGVLPKERGGEVVSTR